LTSTLPSAGTYARWLALVRILTGGIWLAQGVPKFTHGSDFMPGSGRIDCAHLAQTQVPAVTQHICQGMLHTSGAYHQFLVIAVFPNIGVFAELIRLGEVLTGLALLLGVLTRLGGFTGMLLAANDIVARGHVLSWATLQSLDFSLFLLCAISFVLPTGRVLGIDALRTPRRSVSRTVQAEFVAEPPMDRPTAPPNP
jgi:uncharacterized membrane protein YphA (DoxX/SURF4 family)